MNDPLAQFRKKPADSAPEAATPKGPVGYVAFDAKDRVDRLKIFSAKENTRSPRYNDLLDVTYDGPYGSNFVLIFSFMIIVLVEGRNLRPVITALQMGTADFIQEFDPEKWQMPTDEKAPFIESITIIKQEGGPSLPGDGQPENEKSRGRSLH